MKDEEKDIFEMVRDEIQKEKDADAEDDDEKEEEGDKQVNPFFLLFLFTYLAL